VAEIQSILRHKNPNTTSRYLKSLGLEHVWKILEEGIRMPGEVISLEDFKNGKK
jgi:hypothetical protein